MGGLQLTPEVLVEDIQPVPGDVLVLPGHNLPFYGLHTRIDELIRHHHVRCDLILRACRAAAFRDEGEAWRWLETLAPGRAGPTPARVPAALEAIGPPEEIITSAALKRLYGVEVQVVALPDHETRTCVPAVHGLRRRK
jgi:hypothetical protein